MGAVASMVSGSVAATTLTKWLWGNQDKKRKHALQAAVSMVPVEFPEPVSPCTAGRKVRDGTRCAFAC